MTRKQILDRINEGYRKGELNIYFSTTLEVSLYNSYGKYMVIKDYHRPKLGTSTVTHYSIENGVDAIHRTLKLSELENHLDN